jgi:hypothetical protein
MLRLLVPLPVLLALIILPGCSPAPPKVQTYPMGQKVGTGHLIYTVFETQWLTEIGQGPSARLPEHRFFVVRMSAVNSGGSEAAVPALVLEDEKGNSYPELSNGEGLPQWIGYLRQVKPAESVQGNAIFDAPPGNYRLRVSDENMDQSALIEIPLSFGADSPEVPLPGAANKR